MAEVICVSISWSWGNKAYVNKRLLRYPIDVSLCSIEWYETQRIIQCAVVGFFVYIESKLPFWFCNESTYCNGQEIEGIILFLFQFEI